MFRVRHSFLAGLILLSVTACKRDSDRYATATGIAAFLDDASPEAREALSIQVDYRLTEENFARWEVAQRNLDRLPRSAFPAENSGGKGNVIDRAVRRLESGRRTRTAIESAGLSVRDFVLQTIALAQATEAAQGGRAAGAGLVPPENFRFVERHRERIRRAQVAARLARRNAQNAELQVDTGQGMGADTLVQTDTGINAVSTDTAEAQSGRSDAVQNSKLDSAESHDDAREKRSPRDISRDSSIPRP
jgi:hypothetical protein